MGVDFQGVERGGCICPDLRDNLCGGGEGGSDVWVGDVGGDTVHWDSVGWIPLQGGPQDDGVTTSYREGRLVGISPSGRRNGGGNITGGGYLSLPPSKHSHIVHCDQAHYVPVSGGREASRDKDVQVVVVTGRLVLGRYVDNV